MVKTFVILLLSVTVSSFLLTYLIRVFTLRKNILDIPNDRSSHTIPTPRGGGLAIVISWYGGISVLFVMKLVGSDLYLALMSGFMLAGISLVDDLIHIRPSVRLIIQFITVVSALFFLDGFKTSGIQTGSKIVFLLYPVIIIGVMWFINLFNFLDGIDGYASLEAIELALAMYLFTGNNITLILAASAAGFILWNWPKAKIFMGDVGSTQLGFIIAILGIYFHNNSRFSIIWWIILTSPFWFDATFTLFRRWRNKEELSIAHRKHIYQRLVRSGFSHQKVDLLLSLINLIIIILIIPAKNQVLLAIPVIILVIGILFLISDYTEKRNPFSL